MKKAIGYIRVSTEGQAIDGVSLDAQKAKIEMWADINGYNVHSIHSDIGVSGAIENRPGLAAALESVGNGDALVIYSLSRLSRSALYAIEVSDKLRKKGVDLVSVSESIDTTTAAGKMAFRMLAVMAEFERDQVIERTKAAMQHKKSQGKRVGAVPYGYSLDADGETLIENPEEVEIIATVFNMRKTVRNWAKIGRMLESNGIVARNGKRFHTTQLQRMPFEILDQ